jgi:hypothetical protein
MQAFRQSVCAGRWKAKSIKHEGVNMIQLKIQCDVCGAEDVIFTVTSENAVYTRVKSEGFEWHRKPDNTRVLVGPVCVAGYEQAQTDGEAAKNQTIRDWFINASS